MGRRHLGEEDSSWQRQRGSNGGRGNQRGWHHAEEEGKDVSFGKGLICLHGAMSSSPTP